MAAYRDMVTTEGRFNVREIAAFAHRRTKIEVAGHEREASPDRNPFPYGRIFKREIVNAWGWARAIRDAGHGEASPNAIPMFRS